MRQRQIAAWKYSSAGFKRDLIRYFESLAVLALPQPRPRTTSPTKTGRDAQKCHRQSAAELRAEIAVIGFRAPAARLPRACLAEAGRDVLLVEDGPFYPLTSCAPFSRDEMISKISEMAGQTVAMGRNKISYVEGRCVGGGSEINSGLLPSHSTGNPRTLAQGIQVDALSESEIAPALRGLRNVMCPFSPLPGRPLRRH